MFANDLPQTVNMPFNPAIVWVQMRRISTIFLMLSASACDSDSTYRQWGEAEQISFYETHEAYNPRIASIGSGRSQAVWLRLQRDDLTYHVDVAGRAEPDGWGSALVLNSPDSDTHVFAEIAADESGNIAVLFERGQSAVGTDIAAFWSTDADVWDMIESPPTTGTFNGVAAAAMDSSGVLHLLWWQFEPVPGDQGIVDLYASQFSMEAGWAQAILLENSSGNVREVALDINASGDAVAVWSQELPNGDRAIFASRSSSEQSWAAAEPVSTLPDGSFLPTVAVGSDGGAVAAWMQSDGTPNGIYVSEYDVSDGWSDELRLGPAFRSQRGAEIAVDGNDTFFIGWAARRFDPGSNALATDILTSHRPVGGTWTELTEVESFELAATAPRIAGLPDGGAIVVWRQAESTGSQVFASSFSSRLRWGEPQALGPRSTYNVRDASPQISVDSAGNATVVWTHQTISDGIVVYANQYK